MPGKRRETPLTDLDKEILPKESSRDEPVPEGLRQRAKDLITTIFEAEPLDEFERDPKSFGNSLEWAGDLSYPNIVALAEEVCCDITPATASPLRGWELVKDRVGLVGCGLLVVLLMFAIGISLSAVFGRK